MIVPVSFEVEDCMKELKYSSFYNLGCEITALPQFLEQRFRALPQNLEDFLNQKILENQVLAQIQEYPND